MSAPATAPTQAPTQAPAEPVTFERTPEQYRHWKLTFDGPVATLAMDVARKRPAPRLYPQAELL